jgi:pantoate--beta-alanine ligase
VREEDALAKSSRNVYLNEEQRVIARSLSAALRTARDQVASGISSTAELIAAATKLLSESGTKVDYVNIRDARNLQNQESITSFSRMLIAAYVGKTRLIDNMPLS